MSAAGASSASTSSALAEAGTTAADAARTARIATRVTTTMPSAWTANTKSSNVVAEAAEQLDSGKGRRVREKLPTWAGVFSGLAADYGVCRSALPALSHDFNDAVGGKVRLLPGLNRRPQARCGVVPPQRITPRRFPGAADGIRNGPGPSGLTTRVALAAGASTRASCHHPELLDERDEVVERPNNRRALEEPLHDGGLGFRNWPVLHGDASRRPSHDRPVISSDASPPSKVPDPGCVGEGEGKAADVVPSRPLAPRPGGPTAVASPRRRTGRASPTGGWRAQDASECRTYPP